MSITVEFARKLLEGSDPNPGQPSREQKFLSFLIVKNLSDLCETGRATLHEMSEKKVSLAGLPNDGTMNLIQGILRQLYSESMFIPDEEVGYRPNWKIIESFHPANTLAAFRLYRIIQRNVRSARDMPKALANRDKKFFLENIDEVFANIPMKDMISQFKNFIGSPGVPPDSQELVWSYFEQFVEIFHSEQKHLELVSTL